MVNIMENPKKMDDLGCPPLFLETPTYYVDPNGFEKKSPGNLLDSVASRYTPANFSPKSDTHNLKPEIDKTYSPKTY